jgi:hypothetical protein
LKSIQADKVGKRLYKNEEDGIVYDDNPRIYNNVHYKSA